MDTRTQKKWRVFWLIMCLALVGMMGVNAALVDLDAMVTFAILDHLGQPLANGSLVYIIGSTDPIVDPMETFNVTSLVAASTTGDDVILGSARIGDNVGSNGTFFTTVQYESTQINYVYIRFFEWTNNPPVVGLVYWGNSSNFFIGPPTLGVSTVNFNPGANLVASNLNHFVAIPEPSSANLIVLVAGMAWAMRASMKRRLKQSRPADSEGESK